MSDRIDFGVQALRDDRTRMGRLLEHADVDRVVSRLRLDADGIRAVWQRVRSEGLVAPEPAPAAQDEREPATTRLATTAHAEESRIRGDVPLLSHSEEIDLARSWQSARSLLPASDDFATLDESDRMIVERGLAARNRMIAANHRLVRWQAGKLERRSGMDPEDLFQVGCIGLLRAVDNYDPEQGFRFSTYATTVVHSFLLRSITDEGSLIRVPESMRKKLRRMSRSRKKLARTLGRDPLPTEIAADLGADVADVNLWLTVRMDAMSLDEDKRAEDGGDRWANSLPDDHADDPPTSTIALEEADLVHKLVDKLDPRSRTVIRLRFGLGGEPAMTLQCVADQLAITRERVRQIQKRAMRTIQIDARSTFGDLLDTKRLQSESSCDHG